MARGIVLHDSHICWMKGHVKYRTATGIGKIHAWFNHWADQVAKEALRGHFTQLYTQVARDFRASLTFAGAALLFANDQDAPVVKPPVQFGAIAMIGPSFRLTFPADIQPVVCHQGFARSLLNWMREIRWTRAASVEGLGLFQDTSWLEIFWGYVHDTSALPAFLYYHEWVWVRDDPSLEFV